MLSETRIGAAREIYYNTNIEDERASSVRNAIQQSSIHTCVDFIPELCWMYGS